MTLEQAEELLRNSPEAVGRHIVANEDGTFSILGRTISESERLEEPLYDTLVVATGKTTTKPGDFIHQLQKAADKPITLRNLIRHLIATYRPPISKKNPATVIRIRTRNAYTSLGYLRRYVNIRRTG
jgi:hypothetical protein